MANINAKVLALQEMALCLVRKWWRPLTCLGIAASVLVNLVIIPLWKMQVPDLTQAAAYITAVTAAFGVRAFEKYKGLT